MKHRSTDKHSVGSIIAADRKMGGDFGKSAADFGSEVRTQHWHASRAPRFQVLQAPKDCIDHQIQQQQWQQIQQQGQAGRSGAKRCRAGEDPEGPAKRQKVRQLLGPVTTAHSVPAARC
jgi:hypothetical protein